MNFEEIRLKLSDNFDQMAAKNKQLYTVDLDKDKLWELYLGSFPEGMNPVYRTRTEFDCSCCRHFLKDIGPTVWIDDDLNVHTIFEFDAGEFQPVMDALDKFVKQNSISGPYLSPSKTVGTRINRAIEDGVIVEYNHFFLELPPRFVFNNRRSTIGTEISQFNSRKAVFKRSLDEITIDAVDTVLELISSNSLYRGEEWKIQLGEFRKYKQAYRGTSDDKAELFCWKHAIEAGDVIGHMRNHSIGTLLTDISEGMELDQAVRRYEAIVAPANYKRPKAIYTKRMLEQAQKTVEELGYMNSLGRRYARLEDISVGNILFANRNVTKRLAGNVFDEMKDEAPENPKKYSKVEEIPIEKFISDVLPTTNEIEVLMQSRLAPNMVSVIAPVDKTAPTMFKWNNGFSWAYAGNMTDSDIRENVKSAGGKVDGVLRFSIQWNDTGKQDDNDVDAHCIEPNHAHIHFREKTDRMTGGMLDVDIINPRLNTPAVENITWPDKKRMPDGTYKFFVHCFNSRGGKSGFRAEIEFDGEIYQFDYDKPLRQDETVDVANVTLKNGVFTIENLLDNTVTSREIWGVKTNRFVPVTLMMYSPNYWDEQTGIGNRHYMFMLKDCINPEKPNGFYNEFLKQELVQHKHVFEALGSKMAVEDDPNQLSGLGFSSTRRNDLIVRVKGNTQRIMKIKF